MIEVIIDKIDNYNYYLRDKNGNVYIVNIEFYGLEKSLSASDKIYLNENLLNRIKNKMVNFSITEKSLEELQSENNEEFLIINYSGGSSKYLIRVYG